MRKIPNFRNEDKKSLYRKICEKTVLAHDDQYLGGLSPQTALQWHQACYFLWKPRLGGTHFSLGGTQTVIWGVTTPKCPPWRRAWGGLICQN